MHGNVQEWYLDLYDPRAYRKRIDWMTAEPLEDANCVEHDPPPEWLESLVNMLGRFAQPETEDDLRVRESERSALTMYRRYAEQWAVAQDEWQADVDAAKKADKDGFWNTSYRPLAKASLPVFESWLKDFSGNLRRVYRGGSWSDSARDCRSAYRYWFEPGGRLRFLGFRVCLVPGPVVPSQQQLRSEQPEAKQGVKPPRRRRQ